MAPEMGRFGEENAMSNQLGMFRAELKAAALDGPHFTQQLAPKS